MVFYLSFRLCYFILFFFLCLRVNNVNWPISIILIYSSASSILLLHSSYEFFILVTIFQLQNFYIFLVFMVYFSSLNIFKIVDLRFCLINPMLDFSLETISNNPFFFWIWAILSCFFEYLAIFWKLGISKHMYWQFWKTDSTLSPEFIIAVCSSSCYFFVW